MRFKTFVAALAAVTFTATASAETTAQDFTPEAFRAHVTFLADDLLEGRAAGTRGYDIAARYVASQFAKIGLRPASNGSWYQEVPFVRYALAGTPRLTIGDQLFEHGKDMLAGASPVAGPQTTEAQAVFVGYGIDLPGRGFDDYRGLHVRGKVVVVLSGLADGLPSDVAAHLSAEKRRMAAARGAVGLITVRTRADAERSPWSRISRFGGRPGVTWVQPNGEPYSGAPGLRFMATVDTPAAEALFAGAERALAAVLDEAAQPGVRPRGFALAPMVKLESESRQASFTSANVVAVLPGSDPALADEYVLLMAHLDGHGVIEGAEGDNIRNGAMDNATGVATLLEVARQMTASGERPRRPILLAAVTAEEIGLLGAQYLARNPVTPGRIVGLVNLDMPVLTYDFQDVIAFGAEHSTLGPIVERAAAGMGIRLTPDPLPQEGLFTRSDHYRFVQEGVPAVFLMTGFAGEGEREFTSFLRTHYHAPSDDLSLPFNWNAGAKFAELNYRIARDMADASEAPRWYADSFFGEVLGGDQERAQRVTPPRPGAPVRSGGAQR